MLTIDVSEYPSSHMYILCTDGENIPQAINTAMQDIGDFSGQAIGQMLGKVVKTLSKATAGSQGNPVDLDGTDPMDIDDPDSDELQQEDYDEDDPGFSDSEEDWAADPPLGSSQPTRALVQPKDRKSTIALNQRIRRDLQYAKQAGFRVGHLGQLLNNGQDSFVTISCRITKFGISDEALQAWHLDANLYYTVVIRFTSGYRTYSQLAQDDLSYGAHGVHIRVGLSRKYKINLSEAIDAFSKTVDKSKENSKTDEETSDALSEGLAPFFISRTLNGLMDEKFVTLLQCRDKFAFGWDGAEEYYHDNQGRSVVQSDNLDSKYWEEEEAHPSLPKLVTSDHLADLRKTNCMTREASFPLLAMQFALRHLVRCTEYCLVCHCPVRTDFEALKPYVCDRPLCLYQYMALGFGPSIEHEIIAQSHVVDLLVSFCYSSASTQRALKTFPDGMGLNVPSPSLLPGVSLSYGRHNYYDPGQVPAAPTTAISTASSYTARLDMDKMELIFAPEDQSRPLRLGSWVCLSTPDNADKKMHCRVIDALYPVVRLGSPIICGGGFSVESKQSTTKIQSGLPGAGPNATPTPAATPPLEYHPRASITSKLPNIEFAVYDQNFDDLTADGKQKTIKMLLDTLPSITEMKEYLLKGRHTSLQSWVDRLSPAALGVLRWIIASNRSCIVQVDNLDGKSNKMPEERVTGMPEYMQFRFAQGAPDKEQRFISSMRDEKPQMSNSSYPTIFAWHGSSLYNWHSIVREGLHFKEVINGRAYGNGVYFSPQAQTSIGYSGAYFGHHSGRSTGENAMDPWMWPHSELRISDALSLNEIVNRPDKFQSTNPHLVVAQLDWIQTRYLFVKCNSSAVSQATNNEVHPTEVYAQDPKYTASGSTGQSVIIPQTAVSKSRRPSTSVKSNGKKKAKLSSEPAVVELSDDTDVDDVSIFFPDEDEVQATPAPTSQPADKGKGKSVTKEPNERGFFPFSLNQSTLPMLPEPSYATSTATRTLQKELKATLKILDATPLHELGWFIDKNLISNVYQWIVELHSFEPTLPLAIDMKSRNLESVVLEVRFSGTYPMTPPFVRVIRPRFLSFMQGGGGHVTAGGALCMELLTNSGWSVASNIESVLVQVRAAISSEEPKPARLENGPVRDYAAGEAVEAYVRACHTHGWSVPPDFQKNYGGAMSSMGYHSRFGE